MVVKIKNNKKGTLLFLSNGGMNQIGVFYRVGDARQLGIVVCVIIVLYRMSADVLTPNKLRALLFITKSFYRIQYQANILRRGGV